MRTLAQGRVLVPDTEHELVKQLDWLERQPMLAVDTESTGLDLHSATHRLRIVAFATPQQAVVWPYETYPWRSDLKAVLSGKRLIMHQAAHDIPVFVNNNVGESLLLWRQTRDTRILSHQVDPRGQEEGGTGHSLEELVKRYLPADAKMGNELKAEFMRLKKEGVIDKKTPLAKRWETLPIDNEMYLLYAGMDALLTARLYGKLTRKVDVFSNLTTFDHEVAMIASIMDARGFLLDKEYTSSLRETLIEDEVRWKAVAAEFGLANINSPVQVAAALKERGIVPDRLTPNGNPAVDKVLLKKHADDPLVHAIVEGKKALKWRKTWVEKFLDGADRSQRVHPSTNTLRARTARFSVTGIPAQTLPSSDSLIRSCFVADTNERIVAVDYAQQELRFAAAMAHDERMIKAFENDEDLHYITAETAWPGRGMEMRKYGKGGNFGTVYGGGVNALMDQFDMTRQQASTVISAIRKAYPGLKAYGDMLSEQAQRKGFVTTWTGRELPVDKNRPYAALNYVVQSGCRDVTAGAMVRLHRAGYTKYMRLVIHDEIVFSLPDDKEMVEDIERIMSTRVHGVELPASAKEGGKSWGSLYI